MKVHKSKEKKPCRFIRRRRGRPRTIDKDAVIKGILAYKREIFLPNNKILHTGSPVWAEVSEKIDKIKSARSLYTYVTCNQDAIRELMCPDFRKNLAIDEDDNEEFEVAEKDNHHDSTFTVKGSTTPSAMSFSFRITLEKFRELTEKRNLEWKFKKDVWQNFICGKIWELTRIACGYMFDKSYLADDGKAGQSVGNCACDSHLQCTISTVNNVVLIHCTVSPGDPQKDCKKRPLRGIYREQIAERLQGSSAYVVHLDLANILMRKGDKESPLLPDLTVLRNLKCSMAAAKRLDRDPVKALEKLKNLRMKGDISMIQRFPFCVWYSTEMQKEVFRKVAKICHLCLLVDGTGKINRQVKDPDGSESGPIHLYQAVLTTPIGIVPVAQMVSSRHHTLAILAWLLDHFERSALPIPAEMITDGARALLAAGIRAFTKYSTINEYADSFLKDESLPPCYIRTDVAHFMAKWAKFLGSENRDVAGFYKASIGKLILCRSKEEAASLLHALFTISRSETSGPTKDGKPSACDVQMKFMDQLLTTNIYHELEIDEEELNKTVKATSGSPDPLNLDNSDESLWYKWAKDIESSAEKDIESARGIETNDYFLDKFADRLLKEDIAWLPIWTCAFQSSFGYGRCPASSAGVEATFRLLKSLLLKNYRLPLPPDVFVDLHDVYLRAVLLLFDAKLEKEIEKQKRRTMSPNFQGNSDADMTHDAFMNEHESDSHSSPLFTSSPVFKPRGTCSICNLALDTSEPKCSKCLRLSEDDKMAAEEPSSPHAKVKQHQGCWLKDTYPKNHFKIKPALRKVPFLKPSHNTALKPSRKNDELLDLRHTSSFDSLFQLILTATTDNDNFRAGIVERYLSTNRFLGLVHDKYIKKTNTNAATYAKRYAILGDIFRDRRVGHELTEKLNTVVIDCACTVEFMAEKLLHNVLDCARIDFCLKGCQNMRSQLPFHKIPLKVLLDSENNEISIDPFVHDNTMNHCTSEECSAFVTRSSIKSEHCMFIEVESDELIESDITIVLNKIPQKLKMGSSSHYLHLQGLIHQEIFSSRTLRSKTVKDKLLRNYKAYSLRNTCWIIHGTKRIIVPKEKTKVFPQILLYSK